MLGIALGERIGFCDNLQETQASISSVNWVGWVVRAGGRGRWRCRCRWERSRVWT